MQGVRGWELIKGRGLEPFYSTQKHAGGKGEEQTSKRTSTHLDCEIISPLSKPELCISFFLSQRHPNRIGFVKYLHVKRTFSEFKTRATWGSERQKDHRPTARTLPVERTCVCNFSPSAQHMLGPTSGSGVDVRMCTHTHTHTTSAV